MFIGALRKRIAIQQPNTTQDDTGGVVKSWSTLITVWGSISPLNGKELMAAQQVEAQVSHMVTLRYTGASKPLDPTMQLAYTDAQGRTRYFDIQAIVNEDERNRTLTLNCLERIGES